MENDELKKKNLEKEKLDNFNEEKTNLRIQVDTKNLLNNLASKISKEFGIDVTQVKELINSKTGTSLEGLKIDVNQKSDLINVISGAKSVIEKASKDQIELLKGKIETPSYDPEKNIYFTDKIIPENILRISRNPKNLGHNIIGASIGLLNSAEEIIRILYNIGAGVLKTPYHIYLIATKKAKYKGIKK